jgi:hypothetical protein
VIIGSVVTGIHISDWEQLAEPPRLSRQAAASQVEELRQITNQFASWYWRILPSSLLPLLDIHQSRLIRLIPAAPAEVQRPLQILGSEVAVLAGLAAYKRDDLGTARQQFELGTELAREAQVGPAIAHAYRAQRNAVSSAAVRGGNRQNSALTLSLLDASDLPAVRELDEQLAIINRE